MKCNDFLPMYRQYVRFVRKLDLRETVDFTTPLTKKAALEFINKWNQQSADYCQSEFVYWLKD